MAEIVGEPYVLVKAEELEAYSHDATPLFSGQPAAVVLPSTRDEVAAIVRACGEVDVPIVPRGSGTNLSAGTVPPAGAVVLVTARMNRILEIDETNWTASLEPGVVTAALAEAAEARGLYYPPDPGSMRISTIGGNVAENAGGMRCLKYGVTRDYVMGLEVVLADGSVVHLGGKNMKDVAGLDLIGLFCGSEGTLGIITQVLVRLIPKPPARRTLLASFSTLEGAAEAVAEVLAHRIIPAAVEFLDRETIRAVEAYQPVGLPAAAEALLLIEQDGHPQQIAEDLEVIARVCAAAGAVDVRRAADAAESDRLMAARRAALPALARLKPALILEDATVPRSCLAPMVRAIQDAAARHGVVMATFGHAGDGNLHPTCAVDPRDADEVRRADEAFAEIFAAAIELGGTITGEHGVGLAKAPYMAWRHGPAALELMRSIKAALDPRGLFNPGKMFAPPRRRVLIRGGAA